MKPSFNKAALTFLFLTATLACVPSRPLKAQGKTLKIVLVGDSTVALGGGWGPGFCTSLSSTVVCADDALNGRSSKSFLDEGAWTKALAEHGQYYLIQFGHNDMKGKGADRETDPETTFAANLRRYIADARAIHAVPVLVTSLSRRTYKDGAIVEDLKDYAAATRHVALAEHVGLIDLNALSTTMLNRMNQSEADGFNAVGQEKERLAVGKSPVDRTHLNAHGQTVFGRIVAEQLVQVHPELKPLLQPAQATSAHVP